MRKYIPIQPANQPEIPNALFLCFDFPIWNQAKMWSYVSSYLLYHEGRKFLDCELQIVSHESSEAKNDLLIKNLTNGRYFELIVVWLPHANYSEKSIRHLKNVCNRIIFLLVESLVYSKQDIAELPHLANRWAEVTSLLTPESFVICLCPLTARLLNESGFNAIHIFGFWPEHLPKNIEHKERSSSYAFAASLYNETRRSAANRVKQIETDLCLRRLEIEDDPNITSEFDLQMAALMRDDELYGGNMPLERSALCDEIAETRKVLWEEYLRLISKADFMITLPSYFKGAPGRVIEAILCKVPVIFYQSNLALADREMLIRTSGVYFSEDEDLACTVKNLYKTSAKDTDSIDLTPTEVFPTVEGILTNIRSSPLSPRRLTAFQKLKKLFLDRCTI